MDARAILVKIKQCRLRLLQTKLGPTSISILLFRNSTKTIGTTKTSNSSYGKICIVWCETVAISDTPKESQKRYNLILVSKQISEKAYLHNKSKFR